MIGRFATLAHPACFRLSVPRHSRGIAQSLSLWCCLALPTLLFAADDESPTASVAPPKVVVSEPLPELDEKFRNDDGWIGSDGVYSVDLPGTETRIWLFSDTWVGKVRDGKRVDATMVNNTLAVQTGFGADANLEFIVRRNRAGKARSFIVPADGKGYFWLQAAIAANDKLYLFLNQTESTPEGGAFGFRQIGTWMGIVSNPTAPPLEWEIEQKLLPHDAQTDAASTRFGMAAMEHEEFIYVYGHRTTLSGIPRRRDLVVARVPRESIADFGAWRFYDGETWNSDPVDARGLVPQVAAEASVTYLPGLKKFILVYSQGGMWPPILARAADHPWGPWSSSVEIYRCPEAEWKRKVFTYAGKARRIPGTDDELLVSYATNAFDFWTVAADASLYFPHFVRVRLEADSTADKELSVR